MRGLCTQLDCRTGGGGGGAGGFVSIISGSAVKAKFVSVAGGPESFEQGWCQSGGGSPVHSPPVHNNNWEKAVVTWQNIGFVEKSGQKGR